MCSQIFDVCFFIIVFYLKFPLIFVLATVFLVLTIVVAFLLATKKCYASDSGFYQNLSFLSEKIIENYIPSTFYLEYEFFQAVMDLVADVGELLNTSESKLKTVIVQASQECSCPRPSPTGVVREDTLRTVPDSAVEDSSKESGGLRVDTGSTLKEKGKLPFHVREDVRRLITACRLLRIYSGSFCVDF